MWPPRKETLPNGLTVVVQEMPGLEVVALQAWVGVGSADEAESEAGLAHLHEHMLFKGTARRRVGEIAQQIEASGGDINAWTSLDQTVYHIVLASRFFDAGIDVLADALQNSAFDPVELEREKEVVLEEIRRGEDQPARVATQELFRLSYTVHPYRNPVIGTPESVAAQTRESVLSFFRRWYVPENVVLCIVGDVPTERALEKTRRLLGGWASAATPPRHGLKEPDQTDFRARVRLERFEETYFDLAVPIPAVHHEDVAALDLLSAVLGQGESARLNQSVKRQRGLVTDVYAYAYTPKDPGLFVVGGSCPPHRTRQALQAVAGELFRVAREGVTDEELAKARALIESQAVYDKETAQGMARKLGFYESTLRDLGFEQRYYAAVARATASDLVECARRYLRPERMNAVLVQPEKGALAEATCREIVADAARPARRRAARANHGVVRHRIAGGPTVLALRDPRVPLVAVRAVWRGGLRYESDRVNGITNFLAEVLTQGTERRTAVEVAHEVDAMAGNLAGFMGRNSFGLRGEFLSRHLDRGLELFAECLLSPRLGDPEVERQRGLILDEIRALDDNPSGLAFRLFARALYPRHPYRFHSLGTERAVQRLGRSHLARFYRRCYPPSRAILAVSGDVDPPRVIERLERLFGGATAEPPPPNEPERDPPLTAPVVLEETREKRQAHIVVGFRGTTISSSDRCPLEVLSTILSGQGGRLFYELRDRRSLAYSVSSMSVEGLEPGYFAVYIATAPEKIGQAVDGIFAELRKVREAKVTAAELRRAQRYLVGIHAISLQRLSARAAAIAFDECYGLGYDYSDRYADRILAVTREDVLRVARRYLTLDRYAMALVRPSEAATAASLALAARAEAREGDREA